jgi:hypothetical protein
LQIENCKLAIGSVNDHFAICDLQFAILNPTESRFVGIKNTPTPERRGDVHV